MGRNTNGTNAGATNATINIGGGTAGFATVNMATSTAAIGSTTNATLNLTGGTTTVAGDILKVGGNGTTTGTINLAGGTLDMTNGNIGTALNPVALNLQSGTLKNVATINGGGAITKTTAGTLTLSGDNTFTGDLTISTGEVKITESGSLGVGPKTLYPLANGYFTLDGTAGPISLPANMTMVTAGPSILNLAGNNVVNCPINLTTGSGITNVTSNGGSLILAGGISPIATSYRYLELDGTSTGANTVSGAITDGASYVLVVKKGAGTWALTNAGNAYTGNTSIEEGTLIVSAAKFADSSTIFIGPSAILNLPNAGTDTVAALVINGVSQPAGKTYGNASSVSPVIATSAITGPGTLTIPGGPGTPYSTWADTFLPGNNVSDPAGDNDKDGLVNQQEFAFGLSPISGSSVNPILVQVNKTAGTFTYQRRAGTGLTYKILTSTTLATGSWTEDLTAVQSATPDGDNETVVVTLTGAPLSATKLFVRVAAVLMPSP